MHATNIDAINLLSGHQIRLKWQKPEHFDLPKENKKKTALRNGSLEPGGPISMKLQYVAGHISEKEGEQKIK